MFAATAYPNCVVDVPPALVCRIPGEKNGSMLNPGVGSGMLKPTAPITRVLAGVEFAESVRAAPTCKFTATGNRLPPIKRNAAFPPTDVKLWAAPSGFQLATPSSKLMVPRPNAARPPQAWPLQAVPLQQLLFGAA